MPFFQMVFDSFNHFRIVIMKRFNDRNQIVFYCTNYCSIILEIKMGQVGNLTIIQTIALFFKSLN